MRKRTANSPPPVRPLLAIPGQDIKCHYSSLTDYLDSIAGYDPRMMREIDKLIGRCQLGAVCTMERGHFGTVLPRISRSGIIVGGNVTYFDAESGEAIRTERLTDNLAQHVGYAYYEDPSVFFGEHLISCRPLAIVQEEKTALLGMLADYPMDWLAVGTGRNLTHAMLDKLKGRQVVLFPDDMSYDFWQHEFGHQCLVKDIFVSQDINKHLINKILL